MIGILTPEQKAKDLIDYFWKKYGPERAEIICKKIAPGFNTESFSDLIKTGEKWHYFVTAQVRWGLAKGRHAYFG